MTTRRARVVAAERPAVWALVADPYHHPRWWPRVQRVEGVTSRGWTNVMISARGNTVRTDWTVEVNQEPTERRWSQDLDDTPFERLFVRNAVVATLDRLEDGTRVTLAFEQKPRGMARLMPFMLRRAMGRQLDEALDGLERAVG